MEPEINPFASPQTVTEPVVAAPSRGRRDFGPPYASGNARAVWTMGFLVLTIVSCCLVMGSTYLQILLLSKVKMGAFVQSDLTSNDMRRGLVALARIAIGLCTAIAFLMWFHRVHRNLPSLHATGLEHSPGWAVGCFFVPFLNLVRPYQIMSEVWRGSDPSPNRVALGNVQRVPVSSIIGWWWGLYLLMGLAAQIANQMSRGIRPGGVDFAITVSWTILFAKLIAIPAAVVTILMIYRIDANQTARHRYVRTQPQSQQKSGAAVPEWLM